MDVVRDLYSTVDIRYLPAEAKAIHDECKVLFMHVKYGDEDFLFRVLLW